MFLFDGSQAALANTRINRLCVATVMQSTRKKLLSLRSSFARLYRASRIAAWMNTMDFAAFIVDWFDSVGACA